MDDDECVELASSPRRNGGFPDPPAGLAVRKVLATHDECGAVTPLRVPAELPPRALRRIVCDGCGDSYDPAGVEEVPSRFWDLVDRLAIAWGEVVDRVASLPRPELPAWLADPGSRTWRIVSAITAAALVIGVMLLIQGGGEPAPQTATDEPAAAPAADPGKGGAAVEAGGASFVRESSYSLALPAGWKQSRGEAGATFSASAPGGDADATLWIKRDSGLSFTAFEARSLDQLETLAGSARVVERTTAPTLEGTIVRLAADAPAGSPQFEVTLRAAGPYRYYLATTVQPDAAAADVDAAELVHGSFQPSGGSK
jgi:hypothetical protein